MDLYEVTIPTEDNAGQSMREAHAAFGLWLIESFGGFTSWRTHGAWQDAGRSYVEASITYRVAIREAQCPGDAAVPHIAAQALAIFPDQLAVYIAQVGTAAIIARPAGT